MKKIVIIVFLLFGFVILAFVPARSGFMQGKPGVNTPTDVVINFDAGSITDRVWYGTATGGASGNVTIKALNEPPAALRGTWSGRTQWQIVAGNNSFVADTEGKINTYSGVLLMRGHVINGANIGASVIAQGQVTAVNPHHFAGTIRVITP